MPIGVRFGVKAAIKGVFQQPGKFSELPLLGVLGSLHSPVPIPYAPTDRVLVMASIVRAQAAHNTPL